MPRKNLIVRVPCQGCTKKFEVPLAEMNPGNKATCPNCGAVVRFTGDSGRAMQDSLNRVTDTLDRLRKRRR